MSNINNICSPILALTPFTETIVRTGNQGETGLSGPNVQLISFGSGDDPLLINTPYVVGLGLAILNPTVDLVPFPQLGVVINQTGTLSNFEIGYSGRIVASTILDFIRYILCVIPSSNNAGNDYAVQNFIRVFLGDLRFPTITSPEEISANKLITVPFSPPPNVNVGDRIVLAIQLLTNLFEPTLIFTSLSVEASIHFTPSV